MPARRSRSKRARWVRLAVRAQWRVGHPPPPQVTVILTLWGALIVSDVTRAPITLRRPRMRITGAGRRRFALRAVCWSTAPAFGTGVACGAATSNGAGVAAGVTGAGTGVAAGGTGVCVGVGAADP